MSRRSTTYHVDRRQLRAVRPAIRCTATEATAGSNGSIRSTGNNSAAGLAYGQLDEHDGRPSGCTLTRQPGVRTRARTNVTLTAIVLQRNEPDRHRVERRQPAPAAARRRWTSARRRPAQINGVATNSTWTVNFSNSAGDTTTRRARSFDFQSGGGGNVREAARRARSRSTASGATTAIVTSEYGSFGEQHRVDPGRAAVANATGTKIRTSWVEYQYVRGSVTREAYFSNVACDFTNANALKNAYGPGLQDRSTPSGSRFPYKIGSPATTASGLHWPGRATTSTSATSTPTARCPARAGSTAACAASFRQLTRAA